MKLAHAIKIVEGYSRRQDLSSDDRIAMIVMVTMAKRVLDTRSSLRAVVRAVYGEDLNQVELSELFAPPPSAKEE